MPNKPFTPGGEWFETPLNFDAVNAMDDGSGCFVALSETSRSIILSMLEEGRKLPTWHKDSGDVLFTAAEVHCIHLWVDRAMDEIMLDMQPLIDVYQDIANPCLIWGKFGNAPYKVMWNTSLCQPQAPTIQQILSVVQALQREKLIERYEQGGISNLNPRSPTDFFNGDNSSTRNMALCLACRAYVYKVVKEFSIRAQIALGLANVFNIVLQIVEEFLAISTLLDVPLAIVGEALLMISEVAFNATQDRQAIDDVTCCMVTYLTGKPIGLGTFKLSLSECGFDTGSNQAILRDVVGATFNDEGNGVAFLDSLGNAYLMALAGVSDCPCGGGWCKEWNLTDNTLNEWVARVRPDPNNFQAVGTYVTDVGWMTQANPHPPYVAHFFNLVWDAEIDLSTTQRITLTVSRPAAPISSNYNTVGYETLHDVLTLVDTLTQVEQVDTLMVFNVSINATGKPYVTVGFNKGVDATLTSIKFEGRGSVNPFGGSLNQCG